MTPAELQRLERRAALGASKIVQLSMVDMTNQIASQVSGTAAAILADFARAMQTEASKYRRIRMGQLNQEVANIAQQAVIEKYQATRKGIPSYRSEDTGNLRRYSNGAMLRALENPGFITATPTRIGFGNTEILDRSAKQWYRLNFGAAPKGSANTTPSPISMFGQTAAGADLREYRPSEPFRIPYGAFAKNARSSSTGGPIYTQAAGSPAPFYVFSRNFNFRPKFKYSFSKAVSSGIQGAGFLEAGVNAINETWPRLIEELLLEWTLEALNGSRGNRPSTGGPFAAIGHSPGSAKLQAYALRLIADLESERTLLG
jgi:hypothetical protein